MAATIYEKLIHHTNSNVKFFDPLLFLLQVITCILLMLFELATSQMECKYGERGSLTVYCTNATALYFKTSRYRYDHLDETLKCNNCKLFVLEDGTFDIAGNQLRTVDIRNSSIQIIHKKAFIGLVFMETLYLSDNPIQEIYPGAFSGIRKVKNLELENAISQLHADVFQELILLQTLILRNNNLSTIERGTFTGLRNLKILDLSNNKLTSVDYVFEPLVNLEILDLQKNNLYKLSGNEFTNLKKVVGLYLNQNRLQKIDDFLPAENNIRKVNLAANNLSQIDVKPGVFNNMYTLEELDLSTNKFSEFPPKFFQGLYSLRILNLGGNSIEDFSTVRFSGLPHLKSLNVSQNQITTVKATGRLALTNLYELDLSINHITSFDYISLIQRCPKLSLIDLSDNEIPCELFNAIKMFLDKDSINVLADEHHVENCSKIPSLTQDEMKTELVNYTSASKTNSLMIALLALTVIIIILVAVLYYVHFFVLSKLR